MKKGIFKTITCEFFITEANNIHNDLYDYSLIDKEIIKKEKCPIICKKHGIFYQNYDVHITKKCGCNKCSGEETGNRFRYSNDKLINLSKLKFNDFFQYEEINNSLEITCPIHGKIDLDIRAHYRNTTGCKICSANTERKFNNSNTEEFIKKSKLIHGERYDYSKVEYINKDSKVIIICKEHGEFLQKPTIHLKASNCKRCNVSGWDRTSWINQCKNNADPLIYFIRCYNENEEFIKIGRTKRRIYDRFLRPSIMPYKYEIIKTIKGDAHYIFDKEVELHRKYKSYIYNPNIIFPGYTECFNINIKNLIISE